MKGKNTIVYCTLAIFLFFSVIITETTYAESVPVILIDAGHGGFDGGAVGKSGSVEKDLNLKVSEKLKSSLENKNYKVIMVREDDSALNIGGNSIRSKKLKDLENRRKLIKESSCDMFISIHMNKFTQQQYWGAQVWYANNNSSTIFGNILQRSLRSELDNNNKRAAKCAKNDYYILRDCPMIPAVIVECGFLSNFQEEKNLNNEEYQQKIADTITKSAEMYFSMKSSE